MVHQFGAPAVVTFLERLAPKLENRIRTAQGCNVLASDLNRRQWVQGRRVAVEISQIVVVNRPHVVALATVVNAAAPSLYLRAADDDLPRGRGGDGARRARTRRDGRGFSLEILYGGQCEQT